MDGVIALLVFLGLIVTFLVVTFWYGLRGEANRGPALGTNRPYPDGLGPTGPGADEPPYLPTFVISDDESYRRSAGRRLARIFRNRGQGLSSNAPGRSWMDEPGAFKAAGLIDALPPSAEPTVTDEPPVPRHRRRKPGRRHR